MDGRLLLPLLLIIAGAAYFGFVSETGDDAAFTMPLIDGAAYHRQAVAYLAGGAGDGKPYWQPPLYTWWLTAMYKVLGVAPARVRYAQGLFAVLTVVLVFLTGRRLGGNRSGFIAGLIVALNGPLLFYYGQFFPAGPAIALDMLALWLLLRAFELGRRRDWLLCGAAMGAAALAVGNILLVAFAALAMQLLTGAGERRARFCSCAVFVGGIALCVLPVTARNALVSGRFVPISTNAGINLFIGNNARSMDTMALRPGLDWDRLVRVPFEVGAEDEVDAQDFFVARVIKYVAEDPVGFVKGLWTKTRLLFTGIEVPRNVDIYVFGRRSAVLRALVWRVGWFGFPFALLLPVAVAGAVPGWRDRRVRIVVVCASAYAVSIVLFFPSARYRAPLIPFLALLAGMAPAAWSSVPGSHGGQLMRGGGVAAGGLALLLCCLPVRLPTEGTDFESELANAIGAGLEVRGDRRGAMEWYRKAIGINPESWQGHYNLGNALRVQGRLDAALGHYRKAVLFRPDHDRALTNMGIALAQKGRPDEAAISLAVALKHDPWNTLALLSLGACHIQIGDVDAGIQCLERALSIEPCNVAALQNLAGALYLQGRHAEAVERCRAALALAPGNAAVHNTMGMALLSLGRETEAATHIRKAARLNPRYGRSVESLKKSVK